MAGRKKDRRLSGGLKWLLVIGELLTGCTQASEFFFGNAVV